MSWSEYYKYKAKSFGEQHELYLEAAKKLHVPQRKRPLVTLLGGFHPRNQTPYEYVDLCQEIHSNPEDRHLFMDINSYPLETIGASFPQFRVQGSLTALPFRSKSLDLAFLDFTTAFMDDEAVNRFARLSYRTFRRNGLIFICSSNPRYISWEPDKYDNMFPLSVVPMYGRSPQKLAKLMSPYKSVYHKWANGTSLVVFARKDSAFRPESNLPGPASII